MGHRQSEIAMFTQLFFPAILEYIMTNYFERYYNIFEIQTDISHENYKS